MAKSRIEYTDAPADVMKRLVAGTRKGVEAAAEFWDREILPQHFEDGAAEEYGYEKRSGEGEPAWVPNVSGIVLAGGKTLYGRQKVIKNRKYWHEKQRRGFGKTPLVYSGKLEKAATAGGKVSSRVKGSIVEGVDSITVPKYAYERPKHSKIDKAKEMTAATAGDERALSLIVEHTALKSTRGGGGRRRTKTV